MEIVYDGDTVIYGTESMFKSHYVVWKLRQFQMIEAYYDPFKSHYVVWKLNKHNNLFKQK